MANKEKTFNKKAYAFVAFFAVLAALIILVTITFKSKYTAFSPDEVARTYVDTVIQTGDGYNAYKTAIMSKNSKYGDFIRENYMYPVIYRDTDYKVGDDTKNLNGYNQDSYMGKISKEDDGSKQGEVIDAMYSYYLELIADGWDDYDAIFTGYFNKLVDVRKEIFNDDYMTDEIMFTALEANVKTYGESLTGTEDVIDENSGVQLSTKCLGAYEKAYGEDYKLTTSVKCENKITLEDAKNAIDKNALESYKINLDDITDAKSFTVQAKTGDDNVVAEAIVTVVKIKSFWYVDNTTIDTTGLYSFYK